MPLSPFERPFFYPKIILFGDSLTQLSFAPHGVGSLLSEAYARKADVLNRGKYGIYKALKRILRMTEKRKEKVANILEASLATTRGGFSLYSSTPLGSFQQMIKPSYSYS